MHLPRGKSYLANLLIGLLFLAAVTTSQAQPGLRFPIDDNCPLKITGPTAAFDVEHGKDTVGGGSLFCRLGITASQANLAISEFKMAVVAPNKLSAGTVLKFPIEVVVYRTNPDGKRVDSTVMLRTRAGWGNFVRHKLNDRQRAAIKAGKLSDMLIVNSTGAGPGFILGDGLVFFSTRNPKRIAVWHLNTEVLGD